MPRPTLVGHQPWRCFHQLAFVPELFGVDRRLLVLVFLFGFLVHVSLELILFPILLCVVCIVILRRLCKIDRQLMSVLQAAFRCPAAWYDPGLPPDAYGPYIAPSRDSVISDPFESLDLPHGPQRPSFFSRVLQFLGVVIPVLFRRR